MLFFEGFIVQITHFFAKNNYFCDLIEKDGLFFIVFYT